MMRKLAVVAVMAVMGVLAACSGSGDDAAPVTASTMVSPASTTEPTTTEPAVTQPAETVTPATVTPATVTPATEPPAGVTVGEWTSIPGTDDCNCSDGSGFELWERSADPTKVVLFLEGGGACFSAETCGPDAPTYTRVLNLGEPPGAAGAFDPDNPDNPLADYSIVYVPYCTGDVHLGDNVQVYSDTVTVDHNGFANARFGLDTVLADYPDVMQLVVAGSSAGSIPTPLFAGLAADALAGIDIVTLADSSAAYPDAPGLNAGMGTLWGVLANMPDWPVNAGLTAERWSIPGLYVQAGTQHPEITFARFDYAFDGVQALFVSLFGLAADDVLSVIDQTESQIEAAGVPVASYVAPGTIHTILQSDEFYSMEVEGVRLVDFVSTLVDGGVPADVHCVECGRP